MEQNKFEKIQELVNDVNNTNNLSFQEIKQIKKDKGLLERTKSSQLIITEDNKQLLHD